MVQNKPTPEEQLLKLIEGGGNPAAPKAGASPSAEKSKIDLPAGTGKSSLPGLGKISGFLEHFKGRLFKPQNTSSTAVMDIKHVNRALAGVVVLAVLYLIVDGLFFKAGDAKFMAQVSTSDAVFPMSAATSSMATDLQVYKNNLQRRNPFLPPQVHEAAGPANSAAGATSAAGAAAGTMNEMLQAYKLVGISVSDQPLAMIEEVSSGRTFFLRKGQEFKGMKVQAVSREKVTLTYEGQEGDLF